MPGMEQYTARGSRMNFFLGYLTLCLQFQLAMAQSLQCVQSTATETLEIARPRNRELLELHIRNNLKVSYV